ncbi:MAG: SH3 domain-containing protein [Anaerolineales bacterium]|nr:SH3 domain-containing protein [Anaerolineales bacterium]
MNYYEKLPTASRSRLWRIGTGIVASLGVLFVLLGVAISVARADMPAQQPTVAIPTVTGTSLGTTVTVNPDQEQINVRSGPGRDYPAVGVLVTGQKAPAVGRSVGGDWVQIVYPGVEGGVAWVYAYLVTVNGTLSIVEPPPTPTPLVTPTIDPTLAAQFVVELAPTRLPTFTEAPPLVIPTLPTAVPVRSSLGVPIGFVIVGLAVVGLFGLMISLFRGR